MDEKIIYVYENWKEECPRMMGMLRSSHVRGQETFSFEYDRSWLEKSSGLYTMDPDLFLYGGRQYVPLEKKLFGLFSDSCPDRWGRMLMMRKEALDARKQERKPRKLTESDFLLGVYDEARMGALRFSLEKGGPFLSNDSEFAVPPWVHLRTLEHASLEFETDESGLSERWLKELLAPGSSLGGARPKATVKAEDGSLWIAKFPSRHDAYNSGAWEKVAMDLAGLCGLRVPESKIETFSNTGSTFLVKRFDRVKAQRIHFSSAMTLLGKTDGASSTDGTSYLDIAAFIRANGSEPEKDLQELWKRIVFSMAISNTDDHLRNHGFLLTERGWRLSPVFDINPVPYGQQLSLNVTQYDNTIDFSLAVETAKYYEISGKRARVEIAEICKTINDNWKGAAEKYGLSRSAVEYMRPAFFAAK